MTISFVIPVAPHHKQFAMRAIQSVQAQSIKCQALYLIDENERGAGWTRNRILEKVNTPYVSFLDADDWLDPAFAERCLSVIQPGRYVFTGWHQKEDVVSPPEYPWCNGTWHLINGVFHTSDVLRVGGFDESLPALEDTDFYLKLTTSQICGIRIDEPLVYYSGYGKRSKDALKSGISEDLKSVLRERYDKKMGCCGQDQKVSNQMIDEGRQEGDVMALALWAGNRTRIGKVTGRQYSRISYPRKTWVDPRDIQADGRNWQRLAEHQPIQQRPQNHQQESESVVYVGIEGLAQGMKDAGLIKEPPSPPVPPPPTENGGYEVLKASDIETVIRLGKRE